MLIYVNWTNGHSDCIEAFMLDSMIATGKVLRFLRSSGWVTIGVDQIRGNHKRDAYTGAERRAGVDLPQEWRNQVASWFEMWPRCILIVGYGALTGVIGVQELHNAEEMDAPAEDRVLLSDVNS